MKKIISLYAIKTIHPKWFFFATFPPFCYNRLMKNHLSDDQKTRVTNFLKGNSQIIAGYLFGSRVSEKNYASSDLDLGILCFSKQGFSPIELGLGIDKIIDNYEADVRVADLSDDPVFLMQVINGVVIYQKNSYERTDLETRILFSYEDTKHLREIKNFYLENSFKEGVYAH